VKTTPFSSSSYFNDSRKMLSEVFYTILVTTSAGALLAIAKLCFKSKCKKITCFGVSIERDVELEMKETDEKEADKISSTKV